MGQTVTLTKWPRFLWQQFKELTMTRSKYAEIASIKRRYLSDL